MLKRQLHVTEPFLPPFSEYAKYLSQIWDSRVLTHNGPMVQEFERQLSAKLKLDSFHTVSNGTIALQVALKVLGIESGKIITTPFTWIATQSAIEWERCVPVFCDINPETLNIDVNKIEELICKDTVAIMPVHVFGNACDVEAISDIAKKHNLRVIYDAAHALGTEVNGISVLNYGDISAVSLHATKLLNTAEGGGLVCSQASYGATVEQVRFFGHDSNKNIVSSGFNGKMSEIHAALGLASLNYLDKVLDDRKNKYLRYLSNLKDLEVIRFQSIDENSCNFSYFPIIFQDEKTVQKVLQNLHLKNIFPRRYFYPSLNNLSSAYNTGNVREADFVSKRIVCFPLHMNMTLDEVDYVSECIINLFKN